MTDTLSDKVLIPDENNAEIVFVKDDEDDAYYLNIRDDEPFRNDGTRRLRIIKMTSDQMNDLINAAQNLYYDAPSEKTLNNAEAFSQVEQENEEVWLKELMKEAIREFMWDANQRALMAFSHQHNIMQPPMPFPFVGVGPYAPH